MTRPLDRGTATTVTTLRDILELSASVLGVTVDELLAPERSHPLVDYRNAAWAASSRLVTPPASWATIGRFYGRDGSTARPAALRIMQTHPDLVDAVVAAHARPAAVAPVALVVELRRELAGIRAEVDELAAALAQFRADAEDRVWTLRRAGAPMDRAMAKAAAG